MLPTSLRVRAKIRDMICKALQDLCCYFSDLWSSHSLCSSHAGPLTVHPAGRGSHLQAFSLLYFHQERLFAQIAIQVIPSLPSGFITQMSALITLPHSGTPNPTPPGSFCLLPIFFFSIIIFFYLTCYVSSWNLWEWHWFLPVHWDTIFFYDHYIGQKSVKTLLRDSVKLFLLHESRVESFVHCCSFKSHDV